MPAPLSGTAELEASTHPSPIFVIEKPAKSSGAPETDQLDSGCISEFPTPSQRGSAYMIVGLDRHLWFTENRGTIARMDPSPPYTITEFGPLAGGGGLQLTIGTDGNIWFAEQGSFDCNQNPPSRIGRILSHPPYTITEFPVPGPISPLYGIANGPDGKLWFTRLGNPGGCSPSGQREIDSIAPFPPYAIRRYPLPSFSPDIDATLGKPQKIIAGPDGNMWFNISPYIGSISPATHEVVLYPVPGATGNFADINVGPTTDPHAIWFAPVVNGRSALGRVSTNDPNTVSVFPLTISGGINSVVAGPDGNIWFTEARTGYAIGRFEVAPPHRVTELPLPDDTYARAATCGPDGRVWFTEAENPLGLTGIPGKVARVSGLPELGSREGRRECRFQERYMRAGGELERHDTDDPEPEQ